MVSDPCYHKYFVYLDDGRDAYRIAVAAACEESARAWCEGNGEIVAVKDVTADFPISADKVSRALKAAEFGQVEIDIITRLLTEFEVAE